MKNNKGFMMAEVVVVSSIVMIIMGTMFISYNKLLSAYKTRLTYYDTNTLMALGYYRDLLIENGKLNNIITENFPTPINLNTSGYLGTVKASDNYNDRVYMVKNNMTKIANNALDSHGSAISNTFKDYIKYLSSSTPMDSLCVMVMERCKIIDDKVDNNDCTYAYLKVYDR